MSKEINSFIDGNSYRFTFDDDIEYLGFYNKEEDAFINNSYIYRVSRCKSIVRMIEAKEMITDIELKANIESRIAYNRVIVDGVISDMYVKYGIVTHRGDKHEGRVLAKQQKNKKELALELVNAIALDMVSKKLKRT